MKKSFVKFLGAALVGLSALVTSSTASAAIVTGNWDPPMVSPPFDNLGWTTTINFSVPDDCLGSTGIINFVLFNRSFNCATPTPAITVLRAQIGIYDLSTSVLKYVVTLDESTLRPNIVDITVDGQITRLISALPSDPEWLTINADDLTSGVAKDYWFRLALRGSAPELQYSDTGNFFDFDPASTTNPTLISFRTDPNTSLGTVLDETELLVGRSINAVPEPHSLALAMLALVAAGATARKRKQPQAPHSA